MVTGFSLFFFPVKWLQLFHLIYSNEDYVKQLARQPGWQDILTKLYVKESYEAHVNDIADSTTSAPFDANYRPLLRRDQSVVIEDSATSIFLNYRNSREIEDEEEEEGHREISEGFSDLSQSPPSGGGGPLKNLESSVHFKSFDSVDQESQSSSISNAVDINSACPEDEGKDYQPLSPFGTSPFDLELGGMGGSGAQTPVGSLTNTPSPLEHFKPFPPLRPRKSSSLSNVLDDSSYVAEPPTGDTISNTSNPQVLLYLRFSLKIGRWLLLNVFFFCILADPWGRAVQPADQHHLFGAVEQQRCRRGGGCDMEGEGAGFFCSHQTGIFMPAGASPRWDQTQVSYDFKKCPFSLLT